MVPKVKVLHLSVNIGQLHVGIFWYKIITKLINHLCFADDLLIICKGEVKSTYLFLKGLKLFYSTYGLHAKKGKSEMYNVKSTYKND